MHLLISVKARLLGDSLPPWAGAAAAVDLDDPRGLNPTTSRPAPGRRPTPPMGETRTARTPITRPGPSRVSTPMHEGTLPRQRAETLSTRPRTATRPPQHQADPTPRRTHRDHSDQRENQHEEASHEEVRQSPPATHRLKIKVCHECGRSSM